MTPGEALAAELKELEELLLVSAVRKSARLVELLADEFVEFGSSGRVYTKDDLVAALHAESPVVQTTSDFRVAMLAPDVVGRYTDLFSARNSRLAPATLMAPSAGTLSVRPSRISGQNRPRSHWTAASLLPPSDRDC